MTPQEPRDGVSETREESGRTEAVRNALAALAAVRDTGTLEPLARFGLLKACAEALGLDPQEVLRAPKAPLPPLDEDIAKKVAGPDPRRYFDSSRTHDGSWFSKLCKIAEAAARHYNREGEDAAVRIGENIEMFTFARTGTPLYTWIDLLKTAVIGGQVNALLRAMLEESRDQELLAAIRDL